MRGILFTLLFIGGCLFATGQKNELGLILGLSGFSGDVGKEGFLNPTGSAMGVLYKYNAHERFALRGSVIYSKVKGDDTESDDPARIQRGYYFSNPVWEFGFGFEFNFLKYDVYSDDTQVIPYFATGFSYMYMNRMDYRNNDKEADLIVGTGEFNIPIIVGVKSNFAKSIILGAEIGARKTFTDAIDGSYFTERTAFGDTNNKDWYFVYALTVTFKLGGGGQKAKDCRCPF